jgi:uncharacterized membrane protein YjdF
MKLFTPARLVLVLFTFAYIVAGAFYLLAHGNHEFLLYLIALAPILVLGFYLQARYEFPLWMMWLISILVALHLAGGSIKVNGDVLYNFVLVPIPNWTGLTIWKFDQLVHPYGAASIALITYALLTGRTKLTSAVVLLLAFMVANGAGALNEVIEFITKITVPHTDVGGYYNTALDLLFNMIGAAFGSLIGGALFRRKS